MSQQNKEVNEPLESREPTPPQAETPPEDGAIKKKQPKLKKNGKPRMKGWKKALIAAGSVLGMLAVVAYAGYTIVANKISGTDTPAGTLPQEVKTLPEYTGKGLVCFLVCGIDYDLAEDGSVQEDQVGRTDLILYVMYDTRNNKANILQIPRDVYVGSDLRTDGTGKINGLYFDATDPNNRMAPLARMLKDQLGLSSDFYVTINMDAVKEIIDLNAIEVFVPVEVNDPKLGIAIEPGWRYFSGEEAEFFLRNRKSTTYGEQGDLMRLQMQQYFYSALFREFKQLSPSDLLMWMRVLLYRCDTDMDPIQLGGLAQKALALKSEDIIFVRPPVEGVKADGQALVYLVPDETADLLNQYFRPDGHRMTGKELDIRIPEGPYEEEYGRVAASVRTMSGIEMSEMQSATQMQQAASGAPEDSQSAAA